MEPVTAHYRWTIDDLAIGRKYFQRSKRFRRLATYLFFGFCCAFVLAGPLQSRNPASFLTVPVMIIIVLIAYLITIKLISPFLRKREFAKRPDAHTEIEMTSTENGISIISGLGKSEVHWSSWQRVIFTPVGFLLLPNEQIFYFVPNRAFQSPEEIERLKSLIRTHVKDHKEVK